jgi:hypothetical protein
VQEEEEEEEIATWRMSSLIQLCLPITPCRQWAGRIHVWGLSIGSEEKKHKWTVNVWFVEPIDSINVKDNIVSYM